MANNIKKISIYILVTLLVIQVLYVLSGITSNQIATGDAYSIWFLKAKVLASGWSQYFSYMKNSHYSYSHPEYPILLPLIFSLFVKTLPKISTYFHELMWIYPAIYFTLIFYVYKFVKNYSNQMVALAASFTVSSIISIERLSGIGEVGFADLPLTLVILMSVITLVKNDDKFSPSEIVLLIIIANLKMEGLVWVLVYTLVKRPKINRSWIVLLLGCGIWYIATRYAGIASIYEGSNIILSEVLFRVFILIRLIILHLFNFSLYGVLNWAILIIGITGTSKTARKINIATMLYLFIITSSYLITPLDMGEHFRTSFYRVFLQTYPAIIASSYINVFQSLKKLYN